MWPPGRRFKAARYSRETMKLWDDFIAIVDRHFKYLETDFGFKRVSTELPFVNYESPYLRVFIFLELGGRSELDLGFESVEQKYRPPRGSFGIDMLIDLHEPTKERAHIYPAYTLEGLEAAMKELAESLLTYGANMLRGDLRDLVRLQELEREEIKKYSKRHGTKNTQ